MKKSILFIIAIVSSHFLFANDFIALTDTNKNIIQRAKIDFKVAEGTRKFYEHNYRGSLNLFREILALDDHNAKAHFGIAQCQYALNKYDLSKEYIDKAIALDNEVDRDVLLLKGKVEHRLGNLDEAIKNFESHKLTLKGNERKILESDVDLFIAQCNYAKEQMKQPKDVVVTNLGENINTFAPEFAPCISQDGRTLVFTSRRSDTKGGNLDKNFDYLYYTDIYISKLDTVTGQWSKGKNASGKINTEFHDGALGFTPTGKMLIYRNITNVTGSGDIYISKQSKSGKWGEPKPLLEKEDKKISKKINSSYFESSASMTADGKTIYFVSERPGGQGRADIYVVKKEGGIWTEPKNLGANINTVADEKCVFISLDGKRLFYSSNGFSNSLGSYDIYMAEMNEQGEWGQPVNMGYPINTVKEEKTISVSPDGKTAYVSAYYDKDSKGGADIFSIDISKLK